MLAGKRLMEGNSMSNETCNCPCCREGIEAPHEYHLERRAMPFRPVPAVRRECIRLGLVGDCRKGKLCPGCDGMPIGVLTEALHLIASTTTDPGAREEAQRALVDACGTALPDGGRQ